MALAEQTGQDPALVIALGMLATVHGWHGDERRGGRRRSRDRARRAPQRAAARDLRPPRARAARAAERADEAVERLEAVRAEALPGNVLWAPHLVDAYLRAGRRDDAAELVEHYARTIEHHRIAPAILERLRGMTRAGRVPLPRCARRCTRPARRRSSSRAPSSPTASSCAPPDRRDEAREPLREALAGFERIEALPFAERARRELRAAGAVTRARPTATPPS